MAQHFPGGQHPNSPPPERDRKRRRGTPDAPPPPPDPSPPNSRPPAPDPSTPSSSSPPNSPVHLVMDDFPDGHHVRLRSRALRTYLHASSDGMSVYLSSERASENTAWAVHRHQGNAVGAGYMLLRSAAYGRYLAATDLPSPFGHRGHLAVQLEYCDRQEETSNMWQVVRSGAGNGVYQLHVGIRYLRANGRYRRWNTGVTVEPIPIGSRNFSTMMLWVVEPIPFREDFPGIHGLAAEPPLHRLAVRFGRELPPWWMIRFVQANIDGTYEEDMWTTFQFRGNSVLNLRNELERRVAAVSDIIMCVRAGRFARLTPMLVDLPRGGHGNTLYIVVVISGTPGEAALWFPNINAQ